MRTCIARGDGWACDRNDIKAKSLCGAHHQQERLGKPFKPIQVPYPVPDDGQCTVVERGVKCQNKHRASGYCVKHYQRWQKHGDPLVTLNNRERRAGQKRCARCEKWLTNDQFNKHAATHDGLQARCRSCQRGHRLSQWYSLTDEQWNDMLLKQGGMCAAPACGATEPGGAGYWQVDHDHACCPGRNTCGECVRGLLCMDCNTTLGKMNDNPARLQGLADYLMSDSRIPTTTGGK